MEPEWRIDGFGCVGAWWDDAEFVGFVYEQQQLVVYCEWFVVVVWSVGDGVGDGVEEFWCGVGLLLDVDG